MFSIYPIYFLPLFLLSCLFKNYFNILIFHYNLSISFLDILLSKCFTVLHITFTSTIYFELSFILRCKTWAKSLFSSSLSMIVQAPVLFVGKVIFPLLNFYWNFVKSQLSLFMWVHFWVPYSVLLTFLPPVSHSLDYYSYKNLEIRSTDSSHSILFQNCSSYSCLFSFSYK